MSTFMNTTIYPLNELLPTLLLDRTTGRNIIWATDAYADLGPGFAEESHMELTHFSTESPFVLQPHFCKTQQERKQRSRKEAEVMTPSWVCNKMINYRNEDWFERNDVFNRETKYNSWVVNESPIVFDGTLTDGRERTWDNYVDFTTLEFTCGEAPFLVSRYDVTTGEPILPLIRRIGMLDQKLRVVNENTVTEQDWIKWAERAVQATYGYEYQGDSLLIARINVLLTFQEYFTERWKHEPGIQLLEQIAHIISWNIWQMDFLNNTVPLVGACETSEQEGIPCRIFDWRKNKSVLFTDF